MGQIAADHFGDDRPHQFNAAGFVQQRFADGYDVRESETLTAAEGRDEKDEKHICPLQLDVIDRAICLWTNKGDTVFSPFAGIGSEGYQAILRGRRFKGAELKESYWRAACSNLRAAVAKSSEGELFKP